MEFQFNGAGGVDDDERVGINSIMPIAMYPSYSCDVKARYARTELVFCMRIEHGAT